MCSTKCNNCLIEQIKAIRFGLHLNYLALISQHQVYIGRQTPLLAAQLQSFFDVWLIFMGN